MKIEPGVWQVTKSIVQLPAARVVANKAKSFRIIDVELQAFIAGENKMAVF